MNKYTYLITNRSTKNLDFNFKLEKLSMKKYPFLHQKSLWWCGGCGWVICWILG